ncbi:class I SAM-dependent methyltransferase [Herbaspirillum sp. HC18]|nr:class I SAM-dependent methyltransferase [Herbaspirillum sp. HC18]
MPPLLLNAARTIWPYVPSFLRKSTAVTWLKSILIRPAAVELAQPVSVQPLHQPTGPKLVRTLEELDAMLQMLDKAAAISDDELRRGFTQFRMRFPLELPSDPDSPEYRAAQMKLYEWLHGKPYSVTNEISSFDTAAAVSRPFPFYTESPQTVGNHLISIGHLIRTMNLPPKSAILEFGPGWGNTTVWLARMGYQITAIDIEKNFVELVKERARRKSLHVDAIQGDFSMIHQIDRQFDAVLFFECFHHCSDHQALIAGLDRVIAPGGKAVFAAEPITDDFPIPWGLRMDGESLWAIRKNGWLELGFQETYFRALLARHGWDVTKSVCSETPWGVIFTATRRS